MTPATGPASTRGTAAGSLRACIALSATELCVAERRGVPVRLAARRIPLDPMNGGNGPEWPSLASALRDLARTMGVAGTARGSLAVALLPPLVEVRLFDLPPMRDAEMRQLLTRNTARYFMGVRAPALVGTIVPERVRGTSSGAVGAAANARVVAAIHAAARDAGWMVQSISPAEGAWAAAAAAIWPATAKRGSFVLVTHDDRTDLLQVGDGRLSGVRHFRAGAADAALIGDTIRASMNGTSGAVGRVAAIGTSGPRGALGRALSASGITLVAPATEWAVAAESSDLLAAAFAGPHAAPVLVTELARADVAERARRATRRVAMAGAALVLLSAAFELWGVKRELAAVEAQRAAIRPQIASTLVGRTTVETAFRQLAALNAAERTAPRWSDIIAGLAENLGQDAFLTAFRGRGDSVVVDGLAVRAARAFDAMEKTAGLTGVNAAAPVRRESPSGGEAMEHFTIAARRAP